MEVVELLFVLRNISGTGMQLSEFLPSMYEALGPMPSIEDKKRRNRLNFIPKCSCSQFWKTVILLTD